MNLRFGLDIGVASVGWAVVNDEYEVLESGSNIFESANASQNVERRSYRQTKDCFAGDEIEFWILINYGRSLVFLFRKITIIISWSFVCKAFLSH